MPTNKKKKKIKKDPVSQLKLPADESNRERILNAAQQVFFEKGLKGARLQEIADLAQVNKALVFYYFKNKEGLFLEILERAFSSLMPHLNVLSRQDLTVLERIHCFVDQYLDHVSVNRNLAIFVFFEIQKSSFFLKKHQHLVEKLQSQDFFKDVELEIKLGNFNLFSPLHLAINIWALCIFPFLAANTIKMVHQLSDQDFEKFLIERKSIIKEFVASALLPVKKNDKKDF